jgi:uncharacterized protein (DUF58 family)
MDAGKPRLIDPAFLRKLERLRIQARRAFPGTMRGERRSTRRGASVEFSDFRKYEAGDDFRHLDWNIYARLERLMLRQFVEEEDVRIDVLIDASRSMHFGSPVSKFDFALRAAAALSFLAVSSLDRVGVATFDSAMRLRLRALRGRGHLVSIFTFLENLSNRKDSLPEGRPGPSATEEAAGDEPVAMGSAKTDLLSVLRAYQKANTKPGILFLISDFLDTGDFRREIKLLARRGFDVNLIQTLSREEIEPPLTGDLLMVDAETGREQEVTVNERALSIYRAKLAEFTTSLEAFCRASGAGYLMAAADTNFEDLLIRNLIESRFAE